MHLRLLFSFIRLHVFWNKFAVAFAAAAAAMHVGGGKWEGGGGGGKGNRTVREQQQ